MSFNYSSGIRIRKGTEKSHIGRVEIKDEGGEYWTKENAITVCRELGYDWSAEPILPDYVQNGNTKDILWNQTLDCKGHEYSTLQCERTNQPIDVDCSHKTDVGVRCQTEGKVVNKS